MLDEIGGFGLYTSRGNNTELFSQHQLANCLSGFFPAMVLVARGFIFGHMRDVPRDTAEGLARVERCAKRCLKAWCGLCEYSCQDIYYSVKEHSEAQTKWRRIYDLSETAKHNFTELGASCLGTLQIELPEGIGPDSEEYERIIERFRRGHPIICDDHVCGDCPECLYSEDGRKRFDFINNLRGWFPEYAMRMMIYPLLPGDEREPVKIAESTALLFHKPADEKNNSGKEYSISEKIALLAAKCGYAPPVSSDAELKDLSNSKQKKLRDALDMLSDLSRNKKRGFQQPELDKKYETGSDINKITYSRVIAAALDLGEPKRYALRCSLPTGKAELFVLDIRNDGGGKRKYLYDISNRKEADGLRKMLTRTLNDIIDKLSPSKKTSVTPLYNAAQRYFRDSGIDEEERSASAEGRPRVCGASLADILDKALKKNKKLPGILGGGAEKLRQLMGRTDRAFLRSCPPELADITDADGQPLKKTDQQIVLKALSCFLKARGQHNAAFAPFTTSELLIWTRLTDKTADPERFRLCLDGKSEPLFFISRYAGNMKLIGVNGRWLNGYSWRLSCPGVPDSAGEGTATIEYEDNGIGAVMTRAVRNDRMI